MLTLKNHTTLDGFIKHDEKHRSIKFTTKLEEGDTASFTEAAILSMKYFDRTISKSREFYTWEANDDGTTIQGKGLYEVVMVTKNFVVLSKKFGVMPSTRRAQQNVTAKTMEYDKVEKILLADQGLKANVVWLDYIGQREKSKSAAYQIQPFFDANVMKKYTGSYWRDVKSFVRTNRLNLERRDDLMKVFAYYQQIEE